MTEFCYDCKYSSVHDGMQSCAWESGLGSGYRKCERYERDWSHIIMTAMGFFAIFILPIILMTYLILALIGGF